MFNPASRKTPRREGQQSARHVGPQIGGIGDGGAALVGQRPGD